MFGVLWLLLAWVAGWRWIHKLIGDPARLLERPASRQPIACFQSSPWPALFFKLALALWFGVLPLTWLSYLLAALLASFLPAGIHPLLITNCLIMVSLLTWLAWVPVQRLSGRVIRKLSGKTAAGSQRWQQSESAWPTLIRSLSLPAGRFFLLTVLFWLIFAVWLMTGTFFRDGSLFQASYSVFSDFAPHTALVSSFAKGMNWPTEYPHFANDGIAYHFMFYFLCGNLNYLGLPLDLAINLPSILGLVTFCILLGALAVRLTGRRLTWLLAPLLVFCRSSAAFFTYFGDLVREYGISPSAWPAIFGAMLDQSVFIGNTANDSWGLWGINVYANQRHLLPGLSVALIVLFLFLPDLDQGLALRPDWRRFLAGRDFWLIRGSESWRKLAAALLLCLLLPYFHGSVLVALLLVLAGISVFSRNRLAFLIVAAGSVLSALGQSALFAGEATRVVRPAIQFGFLAPDKSLAGIALYMLEMSGLLLPLIFLVFWLPGRRRKVLLASFMLPLVLALTLSLTPDVTVNHKYIMISFMLANIYIADLLARLWSRRSITMPKRPAWPRKLAAVVLAIALMSTGLEEMVIERNISQNTVGIDSRSPLVAWITHNTKPDAVFVTAPYHYNAFYLSGRSTWLGHAYYAWSAGHDTAGRLAQEQWLLSGGGLDIQAVKTMIADEGLDYLLIDDTLRDHNEFVVDEAFFDQYFPVVAEFPSLGNLKVYNLRDPVG